ncbi:ferredoxin family protein [Variovorax sp. J22G73]|jgi:NAD-dependent dihydropyrimidine dehydrogenase PreA subunit|uniref:ferredoxin n=1 Tax=unclassified Variovorax TaxID=663243 RepID=UPI00257848F6|nr:MULTISPECIES: ferredoxin [unclassified Variovorax]MDM0004976.1 ferredoxin family protein [Variovorax sp. J22R203]MDM0098392.1 ferredoxin family protein [Variovorax sp. J22G73]
MPHVITAACIDVKDGACVKCCPVDCIYEGERTLYIHPDECIDCGVCVSACPTQAIYEDLRLPPEMAHFTAINRDFFAANVSGLGSPGGAADTGRVACDHPGISLERARLAG